MPTTHSARALLRFGFALLVIAAATSVWASWARQAPGSPMYLGVLPGPIDAVRSSATVLGLCFVGAAWLMPQLAQGNTAWVIAAIAMLGAMLEVGAGLYAAAQGLHAIQWRDPRPGIGAIVALKHAGQVLLGLTLLEFTRRIWTRN